jgi:hypothetical protein
VRAAHVIGLGLWAPGAAGIATWAGGGRGDPVAAAADTPPCGVLPPRERRALSLTTRMGVEVIGQAVTAAGVDRSRVKIVFASAYGELQTAFDQMEMMESADGRLSPARFKNSVHNTATGLLSIAFHNPGFSTALAAGGASFASGLLEVLVLLDQEGGEAVVAVADDVPDALFRRSDAPGFAPLGLAICLAADPVAAGPAPALGCLGALSRSCGAVPAAGPEAVPPAFAGNPAAAGLPLLAALLSGASGWVPVELGVADPLGVSVEAAAGARP